MARRSLERLRNIGIVAHINAGKTTLTERFLFRAGKQAYMGDVGEGTATMDFMPEEQERGISISAAVSNIDWRGFHLNLIDTPGHVDFTAEVERSLLVLDGAVVVVDGVAGVESQTEIVWRQVQQRSVPSIVFINKLDRPTADFEASLISVSERLDCCAVPLVLPCHQNGELVGLIDLVEDRVIGSAKVEPETWQPSRQAVVEACADFDQSILEDFVEGRGVEPDRLHRALRKAVLANQVVPVLAGSALLNRGVDWLMTAICRYLPSPLNREIETVTGVRIPVTEDAPFCGLVFKVQFEDGLYVNFLRAYSGTLKVGAMVGSSRHPAEVRVESIRRLHAADFEELDEVGAGDVVAIVTDTGLMTGETLFAPGAPVALESVRFPDPVLTARIEVSRAEHFEAMEEASRRLTREDPTLLLVQDEDSGGLLVSGMGELHLAVFGQRLRAELGQEVRLSTPSVLTRQTVAVAGEARGECRRHFDGEQISAEISLRVEPFPGTGPATVGRIEVESEALGDMLRMLLKSQLRAGLLGSVPAYDLCVEVVSAREGGLQSGEEAVYGEAVAIGCRKLGLAAGVVTLEPYVDCEVYCPADTLSAALSDLRARGAVVGFVNTVDGRGEVRAEIRLASILGYATALRSLTRGLGTLHLHPSGMRPVVE